MCIWSPEKLASKPKLNITNKHFWEDVSHRVESLTVWHLGYGNNVTSIGAKFSSEEKVHKEYLTNDVDEVECFAQEESQSVPLVVVLGVGKIMEKVIDSVILVFCIHNWEI